MSKEEPAWKAELEQEIAIALGASDIQNIYVRVMARDAILPAVWAAVRAAEQRGFQAGVNKTGDSVGKLREQLKTAREDARREVLEKFVCGTCGHRVTWVDCPTGGWWSHWEHPSDNHDAEGCTPESESP